MPGRDVGADEKQELAAARAEEMPEPAPAAVPPLTIFYGGRVVVFEDFLAEKASEVMVPARSSPWSHTPEQTTTSPVKVTTMIVSMKVCVMETRPCRTGWVVFAAAAATATAATVTEAGESAPVERSDAAPSDPETSAPVGGEATVSSDPAASDHALWSPGDIGSVYTPTTLYSSGQGGEDASDDLSDDDGDREEGR